MLEGGEDPRFIARRMVIFASEDVGNADPQALAVAERRRRGGRARRIARVRAEPVAGRGVPGAGAEVERRDDGDRRRRRATSGSTARSCRRTQLRDAHYRGAKKLGRGEGYVYPHDEPDGVSEESLLPADVRGARFYEPTERGFEEALRERLEELRKLRGDA